MTDMVESLLLVFFFYLSSSPFCPCSQFRATFRAMCTFWDGSRKYEMMMDWM